LGDPVKTHSLSLVVRERLVMDKMIFNRASENFKPQALFFNIVADYRYYRRRRN
jgi:hypothetical protein